jgi:hypothetical protein
MMTFLKRAGELSIYLLGCAYACHAQVDCFFLKTLSVSTVQGQVLDSQGIPISDAAVSLKQDGREVSREMTDTDGRFSIKAMDGKYELQAERPSFRSTSAYLYVGNDLAHVFHRTRLWPILDVGEGTRCPIATTSHRQFLQAVSEYRKQSQGLIQTHATQK